MAEKKQPNGVSSERLEIEALKKGSTFTNPNNQFFARTQSTPLEDQKKLGLKKALKAPAKAVEFKPTGDSGVLAFLAPTTTTAPTTTPSTTTSQPFIPASVETKPQQTNGAPTTTTTQAAPVQNAAKTTTAPQTTTAAPETTTAQPTTKPAEGGSTPTGANATSSAKGGSLKSRLKLSSQQFEIPGAGGAGAGAKPFVPAGTTQVQAPATQPTQTATPPTQGEWGSKPITKPTTETEKKNLPSPSKKNSYKLDLKAGQVQNKGGLETIIESHAENKPAAVAKPEEAKDENKKEVKPEAPKVEPKAAVKKEEPKVEAAKADTKPVAKTEQKPAVEQKAKPAEQKVEKKEEAPKVEEPKVEAKPEPKKEEKKPEEKPFGEPEKKEVKIEIVIMSRVDFAAAVARLAEALKEKPLPEHLEKIKNRQVLLEKPARTGGYDKNKPQPKPVNMERQPSQPSQPTPTGDGGFTRSEKKPEPAPEPKQTIVRLGLTEEEKKKKMELSSNVNVWVTKQKAVQDPEEAIKKEIKFNLNIITLDNFEIIKEKILEIASQKLDNCKKVAEFIIENAWTQKHYVNIYAKLCDFLGRSDRLNFDAKTDAKAKKKNDFKLQIMKQIQTVFEDESHANYGTKKPLEEMTPEEKSLYFMKKKQRILGNVSFIGELFLEKFIVIGIVRIITNSLLQKYLEEYNVYQKAVEKPSNRSHEDTLEGLLKFIEIIGQAVEEKEASKAADKQKSTALVTLFQKTLSIANVGSSEPLPKLGNDDISLDDLFKIFNIILNESNISTRLDSLIKNLVYRRENKWQAPLSKNQGPKTLKEIHAEFEREQMEMERRADEYREELRDYQPRRGGSDKYGGGRTEVSFQVVKDNKNKKEEETKIDTSSIDVDTNISFRPVRGKGGQETKEQPKKPRVNFEEIENNLKDIYKIIGGETLEDKGTPQEELKKLADKVGGRDLLRVYLKTFYDGRQDAVKKRLFVPTYLIESDIITGDEFLDQFENVMFKMYEIACDYPGVDNYFSILLLNHCKKTGDATPLSRISFSKDFYEGEECDYVLEFYHDFFRALLKNLEEEFADIKNIVKEDDLKAFSEKIKIENYEEFKSNL